MVGMFNCVFVANQPNEVQHSCCYYHRCLKRIRPVLFRQHTHEYPVLSHRNAHLCLRKEFFFNIIIMFFKNGAHKNNFIIHNLHFFLLNLVIYNFHFKKFFLEINFLRNRKRIHTSPSNLIYSLNGFGGKYGHFSSCSDKRDCPFLSGVFLRKSFLWNRSDWSAGVTALRLCSHLTCLILAAFFLSISIFSNLCAVLDLCLWLNGISRTMHNN